MIGGLLCIERRPAGGKQTSRQPKSLAVTYPPKTNYPNDGART